jgi:hypothetical protein
MPAGSGVSGTLRLRAFRSPEEAGRIEHESLCCAPSMGQPRKCVVSFRDGEGVEHVAEVTVESLYEAGALAPQRFRRNDWSREASLDAGTLRLEVCESTFYNVKVRELEAWLKRSGGTPRDVAIRAIGTPCWEASTNFNSLREAQRLMERMISGLTSPSQPLPAISVR